MGDSIPKLNPGSPALYAYHRALAPLDQFQRARIKTEVRLANVARGKERKRARG